MWCFKRTIKCFESLYEPCDWCDPPLKWHPSHVTPSVTVPGLSVGPAVQHARSEVDGEADSAAVPGVWRHLVGGTPAYPAPDYPTLPSWRGGLPPPISHLPHVRLHRCARGVSPCLYCIHSIKHTLIITHIWDAKICQNMLSNKHTPISLVFYFFLQNRLWQLFCVDDQTVPVMYFRNWWPYQITTIAAGTR